MSLLALLTGSAAPVAPEPTPAPEIAAEPLRLLTRAQTIDAPVVERTITTAGLTAPALIPGRTVPTADLALIGTTAAMDRNQFEAHSWEFQTDADAVVLRLKAGGLNMRAHRVYVDGSPIVAPYHRQDTDAQVKIDLGAAGTWRTIRVDLSALSLQGIDVSTDARVQATAPRKKLYILGDSWVEGASYRPKADGTGNENGPGFEHMAFLTARMLNASPIIGGAGGTGYVNRAPNQHYGATSRMDRLISHRPDLVLVFGSINDGGNSLVEANAKEVYGRIANELPGVPVLVCATQDYGGGAPAATPPNPGHTAAVAASPNVKGHVEPCVENWVTTENAATVNNWQYNTAHLTTYGNLYYAEKLAAFIAKSLDIPAA